MALIAKGSFSLLRRPLLKTLKHQVWLNLLNHLNLILKCDHMGKGSQPPVKGTTTQGKSFNCYPVPNELNLRIKVTTSREYYSSSESYTQVYYAVYSLEPDDDQSLGTKIDSQVSLKES